MNHKCVLIALVAMQFHTAVFVAGNAGSILKRRRTERKGPVHTTVEMVCEGKAHWPSIRTYIVLVEDELSRQGVMQPLLTGGLSEFDTGVDEYGYLSLNLSIKLVQSLDPALLLQPAQLTTRSFNKFKQLRNKREKRVKRSMPAEQSSLVEGVAGLRRAMFDIIVSAGERQKNEEAGIPVELVELVRLSVL